MEKEKLVTVVIVEYKSFKKTYDYSNCLINNLTGYNKLHIIIVDNSVEIDNYNRLFELYDRSEDYSRNDILNSDSLVFSHVHKHIEIALVKNTINAGYAKGNNLGVKFALETWNELGILLFTNNDLRFINPIDINTISNKFSEDSTISIIGPRIINPEGSDQNPYLKQSITERWIKWGLFWPGIFIELKGDLDVKDCNAYVYRIMGAFFFMKSDDFLTVKGFDEHTFLFAEEMILSEKLKKIDKKVYYLNDFCVIHEHGKTISKHYSEIEKMRNRFQSELYYYSNYCNCSKIQILLAKMMFNFYVIKFKIYHWIRYRCW